MLMVHLTPVLPLLLVRIAWPCFVLILIPIIITLNTTYRYYFGLAVSQRIVVANINDEQNNVIICCNGRDITWNGGEINFVQNMGYGMIYPAKASNVIGGGHVVGAFRDNDWR